MQIINKFNLLYNTQRSTRTSQQLYYAYYSSTTRSTLVLYQLCILARVVLVEYQSMHSIATRAYAHQILLLLSTNYAYSSTSQYYLLASTLVVRMRMHTRVLLQYQLGVLQQQYQSSNSSQTTSTAVLTHMKLLVLATLASSMHNKHTTRVRGTGWNFQCAYYAYQLVATSKYLYYYYFLFQLLQSKGATSSYE